MFVKFHARKIARSGPANPHMPGLRRPQTRQTGASAFVSLPQEGQRIDPDVLRNIGVRMEGRSAALIEPHTEIDEAAGERAEGPVRLSVDGLVVHSWPESYECPQSVSTRVLDGLARTVFVDTYRRRRVK